MAAAFVDDVVSPELALVDPELAERARAALPLRGPTDRALAARAQRLAAVTAQPPRRRIVPVVALAGMGLVSLLGPGLLRVGSTVGDSQSPTATASGTGSAVAASSSSDPSSTGARFTQGIAAAEMTTPMADGVAQTQPMQQEAQQPSMVSTSASPAYSVAPRVALRPMTLVWARVAGVSSYDVELVRNGSRIYSASSAMPSMDVPRTWTHEGMRFSIRPEDQAFVWPVIDGRRAPEAVVKGTLALDKTLVASFTG